MKTVLIPEENKADLDKVNETVKKAVEFIPVSNLDEVLSVALEEIKVSSKEKTIAKKASPIKNTDNDKKSTGVYCREV